MGLQLLDPGVSTVLHYTDLLIQVCNLSCIHTEERQGLALHLRGTQAWTRVLADLRQIDLCVDGRRLGLKLEFEPRFTMQCRCAPTVLASRAGSFRSGS